LGKTALGKNDQGVAYTALPNHRGEESMQNRAISVGVFIGVLVLLNVLSMVFGWGRIFY
jgi:hypothetical protein